MHFRVYASLSLAWLIILSLMTSTAPVVGELNQGYPWSQERASAVVDLNEPYAGQLPVSQLSVPSSFSSVLMGFGDDSNPTTNYNVLTNSWNSEGQDLAILSTIDLSVRQDFYDISGFWVDGTNPFQLLIHHFPTGDFDSLSMTYLIPLHEMNLGDQALVGYSVLPSNLTAFLNQTIPFPERYVTSELMEQGLTITYHNLLTTWTSTAPNVSITLPSSIGSKLPLSVPAQFPEDIRAVVLLDNLTLSYQLESYFSEGNISLPMQEVRPTVEVGPVSLLGLNETLVEGTQWNDTTVLSAGSKFSIELEGAPDLPYTLAQNFTFYQGEDVSERLGQFDSPPTFSSLLGVRNYLYKTNNNSETDFFPPEVVIANESLPNIEFHNPYPSHVRWTNVGGNTYYQVDLRGRDLYLSSGSLHPLDREVVTNYQFPLDQSLFYNTLMFPFVNLLGDMATSLDIPIPLPYSVYVQSFDVVVKTEVPLLSTSSLMYDLPFLGMVDISPQTQTSGITDVTSAVWSLISFLPPLACLVVWRHRSLK